MSDTTTTNADATASANTETTATDTAVGTLFVADDAATDSKVTVSESGQSAKGSVEIDNAKPEGENDGLILGKFKDYAALEKAYGEIEKKMKERAPGGAPEKYEFAATFEKAGFTALDPAEYGEVYQAFESQLKEHGFNQKQVEFMIEFGGNWAREQIYKFGPSTDPAAERKALAETWGDETPMVSKDVAKWATANLHPDVVNKPLHLTAEGMKFLRSLAQQGRVSPMRSEPTSATDPADVQIQISEIMNNPESKRNTATGRALQAKLDKLLGAREAAKKRAA